jgi:hypothetical protein
MIKILTMEQGTLEWDFARLAKVTGSRVIGVLAKPTTAAYQTLKAELLAEKLTGQAKSFTAPAVAWGHEHEAMARREHGLIHSHVIQEVGFVELNKDMGCSPDGLIGTKGMVQYKCPKNSSIHIQTLLTRTVPKEYYPQLQWELYTTDRDWTEFVSFDPRMPEELRLCVLHVEVDKAYQAAMVSSVELFLASFRIDLVKLEEMIAAISGRTLVHSDLGDVLAEALEADIVETETETEPDPFA